jgi:hypothetical protein
MTTSPYQVCSCGSHIHGAPDGFDERGMPLCWVCALEKQLAAEPDWPPRSDMAFRGCAFALLASCVFWAGVALACRVVMGG